LFDEIPRWLTCVIIRWSLAQATLFFSPPRAAVDTASVATRAHIPAIRNGLRPIEPDSFRA
jgi:hypothetical protein